MKKANIKVICRIRPENKQESLINTVLDVFELKENNTILELNQNSINNLSSSNTNIGVLYSTDMLSLLKKETFTFDYIYHKNEFTQKEIFDSIGKPAIEATFLGYNGTILCYGQTSSGKTYTMEGLLQCDCNKGIIPRSMEYIFDYIKTASNELEFSIKCSYLEIYNEKIHDLLDSK